MNTENTTMKTALLLAALTLVMPLSGSIAYAQAPATGFGLGAIKVPGAEKAKTGKGLSFGRSVFHAGLSVEAGWDSNVFYAVSSGNPESSAYMRLLPQLTLGTRPVAAGKRRGFVYNLALGLDYIGYLEELPFGAKKHHLGASLGADLKFNPQGVVSFNLVEQFVRTNEPRVGMDGSVDRDYNQVGIDLSINKGLLSFLFGYRFIIDIFEDSQYKFANRMLHQAKFKATWRFFPQTSFWFMAQSGYVSYFEGFDGSQIGETAGGNRNSVPLRLWLGATGRLTHWLTADIGLGYGFAHYFGEPAVGDHHDIIVNLGVGFKLGSVANLRLGYRHDFRDSLVGDYFKSDSAYARFSIAIVQRLILQAVLAWTRADYQNYYVEARSESRQDNYLSASLGADYYFRSWLSAGIGYTLQANVTSFETTYQGEPVQPGFVKHRVFGRVSVYY
jgi:hypothetical protein